MLWNVVACCGMLWHAVECCRNLWKNVKISVKDYKIYIKLQNVKKVENV